MTVQQAIKKYKLEPLSVSVAKVKAKELNVDEVLYMNVQNNKYAYIVRDSRGIMLYSDERNLYTKLYKGLKITPLELNMHTHGIWEKAVTPLPYGIKSFFPYFILICTQAFLHYTYDTVSHHPHIL